MEIPGYEDKYVISEDGEVMNIQTGKVHSVCKMTNGYPVVRIDNTLHLVSRLVAMTYVSNPDNKPQVDHIDRNPSNNHYTNLRWVTPSENLANRKDYRNSPFGVKYIQRGRQGKFRVRKEFEFDREFTTLEEAQAFLRSQTASE